MTINQEMDIISEPTKNIPQSSLTTTTDPTVAITMGLLKKKNGRESRCTTQW